MSNSQDGSSNAKLSELQIRLAEEANEMLLSVTHSRNLIFEALKTIVMRLEQAEQNTDKDAMLVWLGVAARLQVIGAIGVVQRLLERTDDSILLNVAIDAARAIAFHTDEADRTATLLLRRADALLSSAPVVAARGLMGVVILRREPAWVMIAHRIGNWSPVALQLAMHVVAEQLVDQPLHSRRTTPEATVIAGALEKFFRDCIDFKDGAIAESLLVWSLASPEDKVGDVATILLRAFGSTDPVVRLNAAVGLKVLLVEFPQQIQQMLSLHSERVIAAVDRASIPRARSFRG